MHCTALQKLLTFYQQKYWPISDIIVWNFNETLTNNDVSFEQPGPVLLILRFVDSFVGEKTRLLPSTPVFSPAPGGKAKAPSTDELYRVLGITPKQSGK